MYVSYSYNIGTLTLDDMGVKMRRDKRMELKDLVREGDIDESKIAGITSSIKGLAVQHFFLGIEVTEQSFRSDREIVELFFYSTLFVACQSTTATDCSLRANYMLLILVEVSTYSGKSVCESGLSFHSSHSLQSQNYLHATYSGGSICESGLSVHDSHSLQSQNYLHATYYGGSICESGLSVNNSHRLQLLILVEVSVKVTCQSTTVTACSHRTTSMLLIMVEVSVKTGLSVYDSHSLQSQNYLHATYYGVSICEMYLSVHNIDRQTTA